MAPLTDGWNYADASNFSAADKKYSLANLVERTIAWADEHDGITSIVGAGDPVLRQEAFPYDGELDDKVFARLVEIMRATMLAAPGVGLAAPQIGIPLRMAVMEDSAPVDEEVKNIRQRSPMAFRVMVNPVYTDTGGKDVSFYEGCLSIPGYQAVVKRSLTIHLAGQDDAGRTLDEEITGWGARIVAHEADHLDGVLYLDKAEMRSLATNAAVAQLWNAGSPASAADTLGFTLAPGQIL